MGEHNEVNFLGQQKQHNEGDNMGLFGFGSKRQLIGKRIAILATQGVEQIELTSPRKALEKAGAIVELVSPHKLIKGGKIKAWNLLKWGDSFKIDVSLSQAKVSSYDGLHVPGGVINPDILRMDTDAVDFVRSFFEAGKPVSSICHGPWMLIEAEVVQGKTLTSWPSLKKDLRNAGANWVNEEVVEDRGLVTSRGPQDLRAFNKKIVVLFASVATPSENQKAES
jgi:protease I